MVNMLFLAAGLLAVCAVISTALAIRDHRWGFRGDFRRRGTLGFFFAVLAAGALWTGTRYEINYHFNPFGTSNFGPEWDSKPIAGSDPICVRKATAPPPQSKP